MHTRRLTCGHAATALLAALVCADLSESAVTITFRKVVDTSDHLPGKNLTFDSFGTPSIDSGGIAFQGGAFPGPNGIYLVSNAGISTIADTNTQIPGAPSGQTFVGFSNPSISGDEVAFTGARDVSGFTFEGVLIDTGGTLSVVAKNGDTVPGTSDVFIYFFTCSLSEGDIGFVAGTTAGWGVFTTVGGIHAVADESTTIPGTSQTFGGFHFNPTFNNGSVAFAGGPRGPGQPSGVFTDVGGTLHAVATLSTSIPGGTGTFTDFLDSPTIRNDRIVFRATGSSSQLGIYGDDGGLHVIADKSTAIPDGAGNFIGFDDFDYEGPALNDCGSVAFRGFGSSDQMGIYTTIGGSLIKVIDIDDTLNNNLDIVNLDVSREAAYRNRVAFFVGFSNGTGAIYVATVSIPADLDRDGDVDGADLAILEAAYGTCPKARPCPADLDGDGDVDDDDRDILLSELTDCY